MAKATLVAVFMFAFLLSTLSAQTPRSGIPGIANPQTLRGRVRLPSNAEAGQGILVTIRDGSMVEFGRVMTDSRGEFQFENLNSGIYWVTATARGYIPAEERVDMNFGRGATVELLLKHDLRTPDVPAEGPGATIAANAPQSDQAKKELATGQDLLFTKRDPRGSIPHFEQVTKAEPKYAPGYLLLATAALLSQDYAKAAIASQAAIQLDKDSAPAHLLHGMALEGSNDLDSAQRAFTKTLELNPESYEANLELGKVLLGRNDAKKAEKRLKKAAELQPKAAIAHALLGNAYLNQKNGDAALAEFKTAVQLDPQGPLAAALKQKITTMEQAMQNKK